MRTFINSLLTLHTLHSEQFLSYIRWRSWWLKHWTPTSEVTFVKRSWLDYFKLVLLRLDVDLEGSLQIVNIDLGTDVWLLASRYLRCLARLHYWIVDNLFPRLEMSHGRPMWCWVQVHSSLLDRCYRRGNVTIRWLQYHHILVLEI